MAQVQTYDDNFLFETERNGEYVALEIQVQGYYAAGKLYGPPEDSYPDEGEMNILAVNNAFTKEPWTGTLTDAEESEICSRAWSYFERY